jgi:3-ketosteroid 9alpha-monooxygenase subunit A
MRYRGPDAGFPKSWYAVAEARDVSGTKLLPVSYLDRQLIVYRDKTGKAQVADAYCPHLGAHLASHNGCLRDGRVVCPFHKWEFDGASGQCSRIPYTDTMVPRGVKMDVYPTREVDGMVMMWYHPEGAAPDFEPFAREMIAPGAGWSVHSVKDLVSTCPFRDLFENLFDTAHIQQLHKSRNPTQIEILERKPYGLFTRLQALKAGEEFPVTRMEFHFSGVSVATLYVEGKGFCVSMVASATPIDNERFRNVARICVRDGGSLMSRVTNKLVGGAFAKRITTEIQQDMEVLNFKKHLPRPNLCAGDGPIFKWRQYQDEFYVQPGPAAAAE